jgi:hypothetical protein
MSEIATDEHLGPAGVSRWAANVVRTLDVTCVVCGEPVERFGHCRHCREHRTFTGTADLVAPLLYAIAGTASATLLRDYKDHPARSTRARCARIVGQLVDAALARHTTCLEAAVGAPISVRTTLPSLTFRPGVHPFAELVRGLGLGTVDVLAAAPSATCHRVVRPDEFEVTDPGAVVDNHVLVLDDVWTTGSNAQSAALALRRAGAQAVSVMVVGRWINPAYPPARRFLERHGGTGFDPTVCPVTGGDCP